MGQLPPVFDGDRKLAESFIDCLKAYFRLNHQVPAFGSYITRIALTLTLIQGPNVQEWARTLGEWLDQQGPYDDNRDLWDQFISQFNATFADSQKDQRARNQLETHRMKWPFIDQYTMEFEKLCRDAGYQSGSAETVQLYIKGLPTSVAKDVLRPPLVHTYPQIIKRATESVKSQEMIASLEKLKGASFRSPRQGGWQNFGDNRRPNSSPNQTYRPPNQQRYNSSNAPQSYNNRPVDMDLSRTRGNRGQGGRYYQSNAAVTPPPKGDCYGCGQPGHFRRECPNRNKGRTRAAATNESWRSDAGTETLIDWTPEDNETSRVDSAAQAFRALSEDERGSMISQLATEVQGFPKA